MDMKAVAAELAAKLATIDGLETYAYPPDSVEAPAAVVGYPETIRYDTTHGGSDEVEIPVVAVVGLVEDRSTAENLLPYVSASGLKSIKQALETRPHTAMWTVLVTGAEFDVVTYNEIDYAAVIFDVKISGPGSDNG